MSSESSSDGNASQDSGYWNSSQEQHPQPLELADSELVIAPFDRASLLQLSVLWNEAEEEGNNEAVVNKGSDGTSDVGARDDLSDISVDHAPTVDNNRRIIEPVQQQLLGCQLQKPADKVLKWLNNEKPPNVDNSTSSNDNVDETWKIKAPTSNDDATRQAAAIKHDQAEAKRARPHRQPPAAATSNRSAHKTDSPDNSTATSGDGSDGVASDSVTTNSDNSSTAASGHRNMSTKIAADATNGEVYFETKPYLWVAGSIIYTKYQPMSIVHHHHLAL